METIITGKIILTPLIPMITALLIMGSKNKPNLRESFSVFGAVFTFLSVVHVLPHVLAKGSYEYTLFTLYPGVSVKFHLDGLGLLFAGTSSFLWIMAGFYCVGYMRGLDEHAQTRFYFCYAVAVGGAMGVAFSANLFTLTQNCGLKCNIVWKRNATAGPAANVPRETWPSEKLPRDVCLQSVSFAGNDSGVCSVRYPGF